MKNLTDEILLEQVLTLEAAEALWKTSREIRAEFATEAALWHYIDGRRRGLVTIHDR